MKRLVFNFELMVVSRRPSSLPMSAPGKDVVFAVLMLNLKRWAVGMNFPIQGMPG